MIRTLSISLVAMAALSLTAPAFADTDCSQTWGKCFPRPGYPQAVRVAAGGIELRAPLASFLAGVNDRIWVPDDEYLRLLSI